MASTKNAGPAGPEMRPQEFEFLLGEGFRLQGFLVIEMGGGSASLVLQKGEQKFLVHCQHRRAAAVDIGAVRDLHAAVKAQGAAAGLVASAGGFTAAAVEFANASGIRLLNGSKLDALIEAAKQTVTLPLRIEPRLGGGPI
jgi:restriction system protein